MGSILLLVHENGGLEELPGGQCAWSRVRNAVLDTAKEGVLHEGLRERGGAHKRLVTFGVLSLDQQGEPAHGVDHIGRA